MLQGTLNSVTLATACFALTFGRGAFGEGLNDVSVPSGMTREIYDIRSLTRQLSLFPASPEHLTSEQREQLAKELQEQQRLLDAEEVVAFIERSTAGYWLEGTSIESREGRLVIIQTAEMQRQIAALVEKLRKDPEYARQKDASAPAFESKGGSDKNPSAEAYSRGQRYPWRSLSAAIAAAAGGICLIALLRLLRRKRA